MYNELDFMLIASTQRGTNRTPEQKIAGMKRKKIAVVFDCESKVNNTTEAIAYIQRREVIYEIATANIGGTQTGLEVYADNGKAKVKPIRPTITEDGRLASAGVGDLIAFVLKRNENGFIIEASMSNLTRGLFFKWKASSKTWNSFKTPAELITADVFKEHHTVSGKYFDITLPNWADETSDSRRGQIQIHRWFVLLYIGYVYGLDCLPYYTNNWTMIEVNHINHNTHDNRVMVNLETVTRPANAFHKNVERHLAKTKVWKDYVRYRANFKQPVKRISGSELLMALFWICTDKVPPTIKIDKLFKKRCEHLYWDLVSLPHYNSDMSSCLGSFEYMAEVLFRVILVIRTHTELSLVRREA